MARSRDGGGLPAGQLVVWIAAVVVFVIVARRYPVAAALGVGSVLGWVAGAWSHSVRRGSADAARIRSVEEFSSRRIADVEADCVGRIAEIEAQVGRGQQLAETLYADRQQLELRLERSNDELIALRHELDDLRREANLRGGYL